MYVRFIEHSTKSIINKRLLIDMEISGNNSIDTYWI